MARTKQADERQKPFEWTDEKVLSMPRSKAPQVRARQEVLANPVARGIAAQAIQNAVKAGKMPRVKSNQELIERIEGFFLTAAERQTFPTLEELCLYCGYSVSTFKDWRLGRQHGFDDRPEGMTTAEIVTRTLDQMHIVDATLAATGKMNTVLYIYRSANHYGMKQRSEVELTTPTMDNQNMTREQIQEAVMHLPDMAEMED